MKTENGTRICRNCLHFHQRLRGQADAGTLIAMEAGLCCGLTYTQIMWHVVLPQAFRTAVPPLFNSLISMVKNTSLAANITVLEMFMATQRIVGRTYRAMPLYLEVAFIYLIFSTALSWLQRYCEKRLNHYGGV